MTDDLAEDFAFARVVLDGLVDEFVRWGRPMPQTVTRARGILDRAMNCVMSLERHNSESDSEESNSENIGSDEAAKLLGVHKRTIQRKAESLGGQRISGAWVFDRDELGA